MKTLPSIKGYLPLRIALPPVGPAENQQSFTSFLYVKEQAPRPSGDGGGGGGATLFVANAPSRLPVRTDAFLRALFARYGEVRRVAAVPGPRAEPAGAAPGAGTPGASFRAAARAGPDAWAEEPARGDGRFAHVVFASGGELRRALKAIRRDAARAGGRALEVDPEELERLAAEAARPPPADEDGASDEGRDGTEGDEGDERNEGNEEAPTGIHAVAAQLRRRAGRHRSRAQLLRLCNEAVTSFEAEEAAATRRAKESAAQPDEDGFVTVARGTAPTFAAEGLEERVARRGRAGRRRRKRKGGASGADELADFYRFQHKEKSRDEARDLKRRFEEDLRKVKKMKEERAYRPF